MRGWPLRLRAVNAASEFTARIAPPVGVDLPASAGTFFLEISEHASKEEAEAAVLTHGPDGEKMRVARRYVRGAGWRYVVRMDGFF